MAGRPFQFLYGAIKSFEIELLKYKELNFNSSMVRLKVDNKIDKIAENLYFNSSMVRLKALLSLLFANRFTISIPLWCD